jgi:phosphatidylinositol alpha-1,6-mannosyltransferase
VEGLGLVFLEAGAAGTPVVGTRVGGIPDAVIHGETGYLVDPDSSDMLAETLIELIIDSEKARRLGEGGRRRVAELFDWRRNAPALRDELAELIKQRGC